MGLITKRSNKLPWHAKKAEQKLTWSTRSSPASLLFRRQDTQHTTVKWPFKQPNCHCWDYTED